VQIQQRQHLGHLRAAPHPAGQDHALEPHALPGRGVHPTVVHPRADDLDLPGAGGKLAGWGVAVAAHQPVAVLVCQRGVGGDVGVDLGLQRRGQHPAGALTGQLVQAHRKPAVGSVVGDYTQHVAAFLPRRRWCAGVLSLQVRVEGTPRSHARGSSTDSDDISEGASEGNYPGKDPGSVVALLGRGHAVQLRKELLAVAPAMLRGQRQGGGADDEAGPPGGLARLAGPPGPRGGHGSSPRGRSQAGRAEAW
jgi:hypothetical protein